MSALTAPAFAALLAQCAPDAPADYMQRIVAHESGFQPYAIHDNTGGASFFPETYQEAVAKTYALLQLGHSIDVGLGQINQKNWQWLGLTVETVLDPCQNVRAESRALSAMSRYNTGDPRRGLQNGYVQSVMARSSWSQPIPVPSTSIASKEPAPVFVKPSMGHELVFSSK